MKTVFPTVFRKSGWVVRLACLSGAVTLVPIAHGQTALMLEAGNLRLRDDIQWLVDRRVIRLSTSTWPLAMSALDAALAARSQDALSDGDAHALASLERELARLRQPLRFGLTAAVNSASMPSTGFDAQARARAQAGAYVQGSSEAVAGRLQLSGLHQPLTVQQSRASLEGSYLAIQLAGQVLYAGQLAHWWGPGQDGSLIWSNAGTAIPGLGLQRGTEQPFESRWLAWLGPWGYQLAAGQMQHNVQVPGARTFSLRLHVQPLAGLELGASRFIQWGGLGDRSGPGALWKAVIGRANDDSAGGAITNEIAGFDARYSFPVRGNPVTLYGQFAGEDEAGGLPSKFIMLLGVQYKHWWNNTRLHWHLEAADTMTNRLFGARTDAGGVAYRHSFYRDGLYHDGLPVAHFLGGDGRTVSAGLTLIPQDSPHGLRYSVRVLKANLNSTSQAINLAFPSRDDLAAAELSASWQFKSAALRAGLTAQHSRVDGNELGLKFAIDWPLE